MELQVYVVSLLVPISLLHYHVNAEGIKSRCESPATYIGDTGSVTCYFSVDLKQSSKSFRLYRYRLGPTNIRIRDELVVLDCYWLIGDNMHCEPPPSGYEFNGTVSDQVRVIIPKSSPEFQGKYECRAEPSYPRDITDCVFLVKSSDEDSTTVEIAVGLAVEDSKTVGIAVGLVVAIPLGAVAIVLIVIWKRVKDRLSFFGRQTTEDRSPAEQTPNETEMPLLTSNTVEQHITATGESEDGREDHQNRQKAEAELEKTAIDTKMTETDLETSRLKEHQEEVCERSVVENPKAEEEKIGKAAERQKSETEKEKERQKAEAKSERKAIETKMSETELERTKAMAIERAQLEEKRQVVERRKAEAEKEKERQRAEAQQIRKVAERQKAEAEKEKERQKAEAELERKTIETKMAETDLERTNPMAIEEKRQVVKRRKAEAEKEKKRQRAEAAGGYRILLMGKIGTGKSATGNTILGVEEFSVGHGVSSYTNKCQTGHGEYLGRTVEILDTPGLQHSSLDNDDTIKEIERGVSERSGGFHVVLWCIRCEHGHISNNNHLYKLAKTLLGEKMTKHMIVLFTVADPDKKLNYEEFIKEMSKYDNVKEVIDDCEGRHFPFSNKDTKAVKREALFSEIDKLLAQNGGKIYHPALNVKKALKYSSECRRKEVN